MERTIIATPKPLDCATPAARLLEAAGPLFPVSPPVSWREAMRRAVRDPAELAEILGLPGFWAVEARRAAGDFPLFAPREFIARMERGNPSDPLLRQVAPLAEETREVPGFSSDPVGDLAAERRPGLLHKYRGRVLLVTTGACAIHCRYCFRREFPYSEGPRSLDEWRPALDAIAEDDSIEEVILSGGDPLTLVDDRLAELVGRIAEIAHVERLRIHTRLPIVIPQRVNEELLAWLTGTRLTPVMVLHANHANEFDTATDAAIHRLAQVGVPLLNQAVLLAGVNDTVEALEALSRALINRRVMPYYLHQLDRVRGAAHFEVPIERGKELIRELRRRLPGYGVPRYVQEVAGEENKTVIE